MIELLYFSSLRDTEALHCLEQAVQILPDNKIIRDMESAGAMARINQTGLQ